MIELSLKQITDFQEKILTWYESHQRDLPWRKSRNPYQILVSEVMLQQTQVNRVIPKFEAWFQAFPAIEDLANAPVSEVLRLWSGLGYNRRALYLKKAAEVVVHEFNGAFPRDETVLRTIPGIGEYTSRAILCFAFDQQVAVVDTNVKKVIIVEILKGKETIEEKDEIQHIAEQLLPFGKAYEWNQALMDYAASELQGRKIVIPKQSKFKGSNRYYRGQTIKYLLEHKIATVKGLCDVLSIEKEKYESILTSLVKDGMIKQNGNMVSLT